MNVYSYSDLYGAERIDSRDLVETAAHLRALDEPDEEEREVLAAIEELEAEGIADWEYGAQLIREDCFEDYAHELAEDIGAIAGEWPLSCIDWERAARELSMDYTSVRFLGYDYYVRA